MEELTTDEKFHLERLREPDSIMCDRCVLFCSAYCQHFALSIAYLNRSRIRLDDVVEKKKSIGECSEIECKKPPLPNSIFCSLTCQELLIVRSQIDREKYRFHLGIKETKEAKGEVEKKVEVKIENELCSTCKSQPAQYSVYGQCNQCHAADNICNICGPEGDPGRILPDGTKICMSCIQCRTCKRGFEDAGDWRWFNEDWFYCEQCK